MAARERKKRLTRVGEGRKRLLRMKFNLSLLKAPQAAISAPGRKSEASICTSQGFALTSQPIAGQQPMPPIRAVGLRIRF
jgi:hypothetical protein